MLPRDVTKLAFQFKEYPEIPFLFNASDKQKEMLNKHYGGAFWEEKTKPYVKTIMGINQYLSHYGMEELPGGLKKDVFGCIWDIGNISHLIEPPLKEPSLKGYKMPDIGEYCKRYVYPVWDKDLKKSDNSFRVVPHNFGLFERAWSLRGFENFLIDMVQEPAFCEELIETIADWMIESIDHLLAAPVDGVFLTDDYSDQRGLIFGLDRFKHFFKPHWKRIFARIKKAGVYVILHVCGCAAPAVPDLIECGLDCLQSLQPEAMDIYQLKRQYGKDLRFWGGLGAQSTLPFGTPDDVKNEVKRLKEQFGKGGGYILEGAKGIGEDVPIDNVIAYLEEASKLM